MTINSDTRQRFIFENADVRGEIVRLGPSWQQLHSRHPYPQVVLKLLGELLSSTILLSATIKFEGRLSSQLKSKGAINFLLTEYSSDNTFRGMAKYSDNAANQDIEALLNDAILALTIEPNKGDRYQGIVDLAQGDIADAIDNYMLRSQQIETRIWLAGDKNTIAGLLLQRLPRDVSKPELDNKNDLWTKLQYMSDTIKESELLQKDFVTLIKHLYPEDDVRVFDPIPLQFKCQCSHKKVKQLLKFLGEEEINQIIDSHSVISVNCEFCNKQYEFDSVDTKEIFSADIEPEHSNTKH